MHYWEMPDHAFALSERALRFLREYKVAPTPHAYELWFNYATGHNQNVVRALDDAVGNGTISDPAFLRDTHARFFDASSSAMKDLGVKFQQEMSKFAKVLEGAGEETAAYGKALSGAAANLSTGDVSQFKVIVENIVAATHAMEVKQKMLEADLDASLHEVAALRTRMEMVREESRLDALTGLANRRSFDERMQEAVREMQTEGGDLCVLFADIDHFKKFNDTWGHATGDHVLRLVAQCFTANTKGRDTATRYGGEEYAVLLPQTALEHAVKLAEQIRRTVELKKIVKRSTGETLGSITLSIGVAKYRPGEPVAQVVNRADQCLYAAKRAGRNRVMSELNVDVTEATAAAASMTTQR